MGNRCNFSIIAVLTLILVFSFAYTQSRIDDLPVQKNIEQLLNDQNQTRSCSEYRKEEVPRFELSCRYYGWFGEGINETHITESLVCPRGEKIAHKTIEVEVDRECLKWEIIKYERLCVVWDSWRGICLAWQ